MEVDLHLKSTPILMLNSAANCEYLKMLNRTHLGGNGNVAISLHKATKALLFQSECFIWFCHLQQQQQQQ